MLRKLVVVRLPPLCRSVRRRRRSIRRVRSGWSCRSRPAAGPTSSPHVCPGAHGAAGRHGRRREYRRRRRTIGIVQATKATPDGYTLLSDTGDHDQPASRRTSRIACCATSRRSFRSPPARSCWSSPGSADQIGRRSHRAGKSQAGRDQLRLGGHRLDRFLGGELFSALAGVDLTHIPYRGAGPALIDLIAGRIHVQFENAPAILGYVATASKAIAVGTAKRSAILPGLPAIAETLPGYEATSWLGILAPAATPRPIIERLNAAINKGSRPGRPQAAGRSWRRAGRGHVRGVRRYLRAKVEGPTGSQRPRGCGRSSSRLARHSAGTFPNCLVRRHLARSPPWRGAVRRPKPRARRGSGRDLENHSAERAAWRKSSVVICLSHSGWRPTGDWEWQIRASSSSAAFPARENPLLPIMRSSDGTRLALRRKPSPTRWALTRERLPAISARRRSPTRTPPWAMRWPPR